MDITLVIPLLDEEGSLEELHSWIVKIMESNNYSYELIFIDDGSKDNSWNIIRSLSLKNKNVRGIKFLKNFGKSQALHAGFEKAKGEVIITMDADLQDSPDEIPELFKLIKKKKFDIVSGWKKKRYDAFITKKFTFKIIQLGGTPYFRT
jgi:glycosyltransferase involved in cell wall biosynthesis